MKGIIASLFLLSIFQLAGAESFTSFGGIAKAGTTGYGIEGVTNVADDVNIRAGVTTWTRTITDTKDGIEYDIDMELKTVSLVADWHPLKDKFKGFRASAGIFINSSGITMESTDASSYTVNGTTYNAAQAGTIKADVDFDSMAPYIGIGWGNAISKDSDINVSADLGVAFTGSPTVDLSANGTMASDATFMSNLAAEEESIQEDIDELKFWPVLTIGVSYKF